MAQGGIVNAIGLPPRRHEQTKCKTLILDLPMVSLALLLPPPLLAFTPYLRR